MKNDCLFYLPIYFSQQSNVVIHSHFAVIDRYMAI